jgi:hypothetical protein
VPEFSAGLSAKSLPDPEAVQQQLEREGPESNVALKMTDGKKRKGHLKSMEEAGFTLALLRTESAQRQVKYDQVAKLKAINKRSYRAAGQPNAALAKQAIEGLGVGTHVMVKVLGRIILRGVSLPKIPFQTKVSVILNCIPAVRRIRLGTASNSKPEAGA